jgi:hypothetical protein
MVGRRADLQAAADVLDAFAAGQLFVSPPQLLDDFFRCMSLSFHENVAALARRQTLISPGSIHGEHATPTQVVVLPSVFYGQQKTACLIENL